MKQFLIKSILLTVTLLIVGWILYSIFFQAYYLKVLPGLVLFFFVVTNLVHAYLLKIAEKSGLRFTSQYTAVSFLKMLLYLVVAVIYILIDKDNIKSFIVAFLILYVVYTVFEIIEYLKVVRQKN